MEEGWLPEEVEKISWCGILSQLVHRTKSASEGDDTHWVEFPRPPLSKAFTKGCIGYGEMYIFVNVCCTYVRFVYADILHCSDGGERGSGVGGGFASSSSVRTRHK